MRLLLIHFIPPDPQIQGTDYQHPQGVEVGCRNEYDVCMSPNSLHRSTALVCDGMDCDHLACLTMRCCSPVPPPTFPWLLLCNHNDSI